MSPLFWILLGIIIGIILFLILYSNRCSHKMNKTEHIEIVDLEQRVTGYIYIFSCEKCGKIKTLKIKD